MVNLFSTLLRRQDVQERLSSDAGVCAQDAGEEQRAARSDGNRRCHLSLRRDWVAGQSIAQTSAEYSELRADRSHVNVPNSENLVGSGTKRLSEARAMERVRVHSSRTRKVFLHAGLRLSVFKPSMGVALER